MHASQSSEAPDIPRKYGGGRERVSPAVMRKGVLGPGVCSAQLRLHLCPLPLILHFSVMPPRWVATCFYRDLPQGQTVISLPHMAFCTFGIICGKLSPQSMFFLTQQAPWVGVGARCSLRNLEYLLRMNFNTAQINHM